MLKAVLFDWGNTLVAWEFDEELFVEGHVQGLAALPGPVPAQQAFTDAYVTALLGRLLDQGEDEVDYAAEVAALLRRLGTDVDATSVMPFLAAEQRVWRPAHRLQPEIVAALDALRAHGLKVGLVSNVFDPPVLMLELFAELGLLARLDAIALSAEVGKRKPHAAIFEAALSQAGVAADEAVMVGDRLREDIGGAQALGLRAIQARWFQDDDSAAAEPDAVAETPADVVRWVEARRVTT